MLTICVWVGGTVLTSEGLCVGTSWHIVAHCSGPAHCGPVLASVDQYWPVLASVRVCVGTDEDERQPTWGHCWFSTKFSGRVQTGHILGIYWLFLLHITSTLSATHLLCALQSGILIDRLIEWSLNNQHWEAQTLLFTRKQDPSPHQAGYWSELRTCPELLLLILLKHQVSKQNSHKYHCWLVRFHCLSSCELLYTQNSTQW